MGSAFQRRPMDYPKPIESRIAYKMQEKPSAVFEQTASGWKLSAQSIPRSSCGRNPREFDFAPGTILLREWGDREHRVTVTATGLFGGAALQSLTAVAR